MAEMPNEVLFDVRLVERHIRQGVCTREQYDKYIAQLDDAAKEADVIDLEMLASTPGTGVSHSN